MFKALGLSPSARTCTRSSFHSPRSTVAELPQYGSVSRSRRHAICRTWPARAWPTGSWQAGALYRRRPDIAIEPLLAKREDELRQARRSSSNLMKAFRQASARITRPSSWKSSPGRATSEPYRQLPDAAQDQIRGFDRPPYVMSPEENINQEATRIREGISYRVVYSAQAVMWPGRLEGDIRDALAAGEQIRVRPDLPTKLWIVDDKMAMILSSHDTV